MTKKEFHLLMLFAGLTLVLACQWLSPQKAQEIAQQTLPTLAQVATQAAVTGETPAVPTREPAEPPEARLPQDDASLRSYRLHQDLVVETPLLPQSPVTLLEVLREQQQEPTPLTHMVVKAGMPLTLRVEEYETPEAIYFRHGEAEAWTILGSAEQQMDTLDPGALAWMPVVGMITTEVQAQPATLNGQPVFQYVWESEDPEQLSAFGDADWGFSGTPLEGARLTPHKVRVELWTSAQGTILKERVRLEGELALQSQTAPGTVTWTMEVSDLNAPLNLALPEEVQAQQSGAQAPLPLPEGARLQASLPGMSTYEVPGFTVEALLQFWTQEQGLQIVSQTGDANNGLLVTVQKPDGTTVQALLAASSAGVQVLFTSP